jgi:putative Mn2+ efflux pump MntP
MDYWMIIFIAIGLAADAFAVSVARSMANKRARIRSSLVMAASFGFFQGMMPVLGYYLGMILLSFVSSLDHWIAFFLLIFVGGKMIYESKMVKEEETDQKTILILSIATSIDAFAIGLSFSFLKIMIFEAAVIIGFVTFVISLSGCYIGRKFGGIIKNKVEIGGGIILILIGLKILVDHLFPVNFL